MRIYTSQLNISGSTHISGSGTRISSQNDYNTIRFDSTRAEMAATLNHSSSYHGQLFNDTIVNDPGVTGGLSHCLFGVVDDHAKSLVYEYGVYGEIKGASGYVELTSSQGGYGGPDIPMSGSYLVELHIVGIESGSQTGGGSTRPEIFSGILTNTAYRWNIVDEGLTNTPDTVVYRFRDDAIWDAGFIVDNTNHYLRVFAIDNGEDSVWSGTVRVWSLTEDIYGGNLGT